MSIKKPRVTAGLWEKNKGGLILLQKVEFNTTFIDRECKRCGHFGQPLQNGEPNEVHGYKLVCSHCGFFLAWGGRAKKIKDSDGERSFSTQWTPKRLNIEECQLCRRGKAFIEDCGEKLESHHLQAIKDGGEDEPYNILVVCTPCHRVIHHNQTYYGHMRAFYEAWAKWRKTENDGGVNTSPVPLMMQAPPVDYQKLNGGTDGKQQ